MCDSFWPVGIRCTTARVAGSTIEIVGLHERERWQRSETISRLIGRLSLLINPYAAFKDFDIHLKQANKLFALRKTGSEVLNFAAAKFDFRWDGAEPVQVVAVKVEVPFECEDLPPLAESDRTAHIADCGIDGGIA